MTAEDVLDIYHKLLDHRITVYIDGGWCVDALLGRQTRDHPDLDIAVDRKDAITLKKLLVRWGFSDISRNDASEWNYVMTDKAGRLIDVHVYQFDNDGNNIYGIEYPKDSLTGRGRINDQPVKCIDPKWMFTFKTAYEPKDKDLSDVRALGKKFGFKLPDRYKP